MAILRGPGAGGGGVSGILHDTFTQTNGTALNSYGKWTTSGTGTAEVQGNSGRLVPTGTGTITITSVGTALTSFLHVRGSISQTGTNNSSSDVAIAIAGVGTFSVAAITRLGSSNQTSDYTFSAAKADDGFWYIKVQACPVMSVATGTVGATLLSEGSNGNTPTGLFSISLGTGDASNVYTLTIDNIVYG